MVSRLARWALPAALPACIAVAWLASPHLVPQASRPGLPDIGETGNIDPAARTATPAVLSARLAGDALMIGGVLPPDAAKAALIAHARTLFPGRTVQDGSESDAAAAIGDAAAWGLSQLALLAAGDVRIDGDVVTLQGEAPTFDAYEAISRATETPPPGLRFSAAAVRPPAPELYRWSAVREGDDLILAGYVPSTALREAIAEAAAVPGGRVQDETRVARGGPDGVDRLAAARLALAFLAETAEGRVELSGGALSLAGSPRTPESVEALRGAIASPPAGLRLGSVTIAPRTVEPYAFTVVRNAEAVRLGGFYQDRQMHERIHALVRSRFHAQPVVDEMAYALGAPEGYLAGVKAALDGVSRLATGQASLSGTTLTLEGESLYAQAGARIEQAAARELPSGWTGRAAIRSPGSAGTGACQSSANDHLHYDPVRFETDGAGVEPESEATLLAVASALSKCGTVPLQIVARASSEASLPLARRRAEAVVDRLAASGIARGRMTAGAATGEAEGGRVVEIAVQP